MSDKRKREIQDLFMEFDQWFDKNGKEANFDRGFIDSINDKFDKYGDLTERQYAALVKIINSWCRKD